MRGQMDSGERRNVPFSPVPAAARGEFSLISSSIARLCSFEIAKPGLGRRQSGASSA